MFPYWTFIKYGIPLLIGAMIAGGAVWKVQQLRIEQRDAELAAARSVYEANVKAISDLKAEVEKGQKTCAARVGGKDQTIRRLKEIDGLKESNEKGVIGNGGSGITAELDRMWEAVGAN